MGTDCLIAEVILKDDFDMEPARSKTISTSSGITGNESLRSRLSKRSSGMKPSKI